MSPEQAKGKAVDRRADIWSFGVVLYEMLTGTRPFQGDDVTDILASVLKDTPAFDALPAATSPRLRWILERCLERDPRARLRDIGEARLQLAAIAGGNADGGAAWGTSGLAAGAVQARVDAAVTQARRHTFARHVLPLLVLASLAIIVAIVGLSRRATPPVRPSVTRMLVRVPEGRVLGASVRTMALSPSGNELVYLTDTQLLIRKLSEFELKPIAAADLGQNLQSPAFSPDGQWIAFFSAADRVIKRISVQGGAALPVCQTNASGLDWDSSGILVAQGANGVVRCNPGRSAPEQLAKIDDGEFALGPQMLPGERLLFTIAKIGDGVGLRWDQARVVVQSMQTGERRTILDGGSDARVLSTGHLIYAMGGVVFAVPFDLETAEPRGVAFPVVEGVRRGTSGALQLAVSNAGSLVYMPGPTGSNQALRGLAFGDRAGNITRLPVPPGAYLSSARFPRRHASGDRDRRWQASQHFDLPARRAELRQTPDTRGE